MRPLLILTILLLACFISSVPLVAAGPEVIVTSPANGATIQGTDVTVAFQTTDFTLVPSSVPVSEAGKRPEANRPGEGHLHFMLDLQPLVLWDKADPYTFTDIPPGEHQLMVELVNNDHSPLTPPVVQLIRFRTEGTQGQPDVKTGPQLMVTAPINAASIIENRLAVTFEATNFDIVPSSVPVSEAGKHPEMNRPGEGHVHLRLDLQPLVVWYQADPYTFSDLQPGDHQLMIELVNNDGSSLTPPVVQIVPFRVEPLLPTTGRARDPELASLLSVFGLLLTIAGALIKWHAHR